MDNIFKDIQEYTPEEAKRVLKMISECCYKSVSLNMNDTFGWACAESEDCESFDWLVVTNLFEKYGNAGVYAWVAVKTEQEPLEKLRTENYKLARKEIESNLNNFYWLLNYKVKNI